MNLNAPLRTIGTVRCGYRDLEATPIQAGVNRAEQAVLELEPEFADGLDGLGGFEYAWLLTWLLGQPGGEVPALQQVPFLLRPQSRRMGIFRPGGLAGSIRSASASFRSSRSAGPASPSRAST